MKTLVGRSTLTFLVLDLVFNPIVIIAFLSLLGVRGMGESHALLAFFVLIKIAGFSLFLFLFLRPYQHYAAARERNKRELVLAADRALQAFPLKFGVVYACSWSLTYALGFIALWWMHDGDFASGARTTYSVALVAIAVWFGGVAFGFPVASMLVSNESGECSRFARANSITLDRAPTTLQFRIGFVALSLGLGPTLWMTALGYMKQVDGSQQQTALAAEIAATELARVVTSAGPESGPEQRAELERVLELADSEGGVLFLMDDQGRPLTNTEQAASLLGDPSLRSLLTPDRLSEPVSIGLTLGLQAVAHRRIDADRVAVAIIEPAANPASSFVWSAGIFAVVVGLWAPLCAIVLGRAVSGPIERLTAAAREIVEEGKQSEMETIPVPRNDEVGSLTERFNDLLDMMRDLSQAADAIASGDLRVKIARDGELPDAFRRMVEALVGMVSQIRETSVELAGAAAEIFAASQEQEAAATSQSSAMEEISRTMDSLSESAAHVSDSVGGVLSNAEQTLQNTDSMVSRIGQLSGHAGRIVEILDVIREIADKSDLLALNGSLEASRAGEGGQGFALVAAEMRRLAVRVTASVEDVKKLVADIRESGSSTVMATQESKRLAEGTTEAARQITFVTQQQRSGTEQVSQSVKNIAEVVTQAVSATAQTRTSAEALKTQADRLGELVQRFEVTVVREA